MQHTETARPALSMGTIGPRSLHFAQFIGGVLKTLEKQLTGIAYDDGVHSRLYGPVSESVYPDPRGCKPHIRGTCFFPIF